MSVPLTSWRVGKSISLLVLTLVCLCLALPHARAQSALHSAPITRVAVDPANRVLATASEDKTVRIWQLPAGRLLHAIEAPSKPGEHGKIYALAISPNGQQIAFAGYTGQKNERVVEGKKRFDYEIYIHQLSSGKRLHTLDVPGIIDGLAWSATGQLLLATTSDWPPLNLDVEVPTAALHVFRAPKYTRVPEAPGGFSFAAVAGYAREGRLIAIHRPGGSFAAETFDADFRRIEMRQFSGTPAALSISPDGSMVAVTTLFSQLAVHDANDLSVLHQQDFPHAGAGRTPVVRSGEHSTVAWSTDGQSLYFAGRATCDESGCAVRKWTARDWSTYTDVPVSPHRVTHLVALKDGGFAFGTAGAGLGVVDASHRRILYLEPPPMSSQRPDPGTPTPHVGEFWTECIVPGRDLLPNGEFPHVRGKFLYIDKAGTAVLAPPFDSVLEFSEGLARVSLDGKYGYIDRSGRLAIPVQFADARDFSGGRAAVLSGDLVGYIDATGKIAIPARYSMAGDFSGGLARVVEYGRNHFGYINVLGQTVIAPRFEEASDFRDGVAAVRLNGTWGSINGRGEWVAIPQSGSPPPQTADARFDGPRPFFDGGLWGYVNETAQVVITPQFHEARPFSEGVAPVCVSADRLGAIPFAVPPLATAPPPATRADIVPVPRPDPLRLSDDDQRRLADLHDEVVSLSREHRYHEAIGPAQEALGAVELRLSRDDPALIRPLWDLGRVHHALANYRAFIAVGAVPSSSLWREARNLFQRALELTEHSRGAYHPDAGALASELGDLLASQRDFDLAIDMKQRALAIARKTSGDRSVTALKAANDLEIVRVEKLVTPGFGGGLNTALPIALAQIRQAEATLGPDHPNVARGLSNLAAIYGSSKVGVRSASIALYEQALALYAKVGDDRQQALKARAAVARLSVEAGQYVAAERAFESLESSTNLTAVLGADHPAVTDLWRERAYSLEGAGRYEAAAGLFARVVSFWENRLREGSPGATTQLRSARESLADTRRFTGEYAAAEGLYRRILDSEDELRLAVPWPVGARLLRKLGTVQRLRGDVSAARNSFEDVLDLLKPHLPSSPTSRSIADLMTADALRELIALDVSSNDLNTARDHLRRAAALDDRVFWLFSDDRSMVDPDRDRTRSQFYHQMLTVTGRHLRGDPEWVSRAYDLVLDRKGIALDLQLQPKSATKATPERMRRQLEELADARNALARAMIRRPESITSAQYAETVTRLFEREVTLEEEVSRDARLDLWFNLADRRRRVITADVVAGLPADTAVIEFVRVRDEDPASLDTARPPDENATYLAFVLTPGGISLVELGSASVIDVLARNLQAAMRVDATGALTTGLLRELHDRVWLPLEPALAGRPQVVVSPDGELHRVPFPALMEPAGGFLIERFRVAYLTSGRDLARSERTRAKPVLDLALIADPDFGPGGRFPSLPGTAIEAEQIPPLIPRGKPRRVLRAKAATETAFKRLPPTRILHVATHGFFLDSAFDREAAWFEHALIRSGLVLAGANDSARRDVGDDGILTALEVSGLDLSATELVVLASCDSGAGSITYGQGVLGLRRALRVAGAQSVLMALWPVDDELTAQMMVDFYRHRASLQPAMALWRAQIDAIRRMRAQHGFAAPQRWAAFILESATAFEPSAASK